uniref:Uncharacterized protein n=1 Tax=Romanomermis culicivorax TaxID=13658 RepID=A0A915JRV7_ROMCU
MSRVHGSTDGRAAYKILYFFIKLYDDENRITAGFMTISHRFLFNESSIIMNAGQKQISSSKNQQQFTHKMMKGLLDTLQNKDCICKATRKNYLCNNNKHKSSFCSIGHGYDKIMVDKHNLHKHTVNRVPIAKNRSDRLASKFCHDFRSTINCDIASPEPIMTPVKVGTTTCLEDRLIFPITFHFFDRNFTMTADDAFKKLMQNQSICSIILRFVIFAPIGSIVGWFFWLTALDGLEGATEIWKEATMYGCMLFFGLGAGSVPVLRCLTFITFVTVFFGEGQAIVNIALMIGINNVFVKNMFVNMDVAYQVIRCNMLVAQNLTLTKEKVMVQPNRHGGTTKL